MCVLNDPRAQALCHSHPTGRPYLTHLSTKDDGGTVSFQQQKCTVLSEIEDTALSSTAVITLLRERAQNNLPRHQRCHLLEATRTSHQPPHLLFEHNHQRTRRAFSPLVPSRGNGKLEHGHSTCLVVNHYPTSFLLTHLGNNTKNTCILKIF